MNWLKPMMCRYLAIIEKEINKKMKTERTYAGIPKEYGSAERPK